MLLDVSTQKGYDIACALRGPDWTGRCDDEPSETNKLKWLITARIRVLIGVRSNEGCSLRYTSYLGTNIEEWILVPQNVISAVRNHWHFASHALSALSQIAKAGDGKGANEASCLYNWLYDVMWAISDAYDPCLDYARALIALGNEDREKIK